MDVQLLKNKMKNNGYDAEYIDLCVRYAEKLNEKNLPVIFDIQHLSLLTEIEYMDFIKIYNSLNNCYSYKEIEKRSGGIRKLDMPSENLKVIQRWILQTILYNVSCSNNAMGFKKDKSIVTNANVHVGKECVINLDIKDFFPSIHFGRVKGLFKSLGYSTNMSYVLGNLCTYKGYLPQGAPTSPYITNLVCLKLDRRLNGLCKKHGYEYTRYADDITISGEKSAVKLISIVKKIINEEGFITNSEKERVLMKYNSQIVTGIVVNNTMKPKNSYLRKLRQEIYYIKKFGFSGHTKKRAIDKSNYIAHLYGKAFFIKMVNEDLGKFYLNQLNDIDWES